MLPQRPAVCASVIPPVLEEDSMGKLHGCPDMTSYVFSMMRSFYLTFDWWQTPMSILNMVFGGCQAALNCTAITAQKAVALFGTKTRHSEAVCYFYSTPGFPGKYDRTRIVLRVKRLLRRRFTLQPIEWNPDKQPSSTPRAVVKKTKL